MQFNWLLFNAKLEEEENRKEAWYINCVDNDFGPFVLLYRGQTVLVGGEGQGVCGPGAEPR